MLKERDKKYPDPITFRPSAMQPELLEIVRVRWGKKSVAAVVRVAIDRLLVDEGLMKDAA